ncbi:SDR family NAD(P)-dependent oxidoreductase [Namhaeicola litoreus]|uniref:SDR family NAD(P)-dependent oxidoreductase n=1 Tax=Namhaeicola litoreus TaxID=1052145 RepID=A0ABW3Y3Z4_9FLAO
MRTILVVGGSKGVGERLVALNIDNNRVINFSRSKPNVDHANLTHFEIDILSDELPNLDQVDQIFYCPGSINLKPFNRLSQKDFQNDLEINFFGAVRVIQKYLDVLKKGHDPSIILFSTVAVKMGMTFHASIGAAKGAVEGLVKSLAAEFAPTIRINAVAPTITNTSLASSILRNDAMMEKMIERHPLKKILDPEEVASMANYLSSPIAKSISGQVIEMDCGIVNLK